MGIFCHKCEELEETFGMKIEGLKDKVANMSLKLDDNEISVDKIVSMSFSINEINKKLEGLETWKCNAEVGLNNNARWRTEVDKRIEGLQTTKKKGSKRNERVVSRP
jgi:hypothetical protein